MKERKDIAQLPLNDGNSALKDEINEKEQLDPHKDLYSIEWIFWNSWIF